MNSKDGKGYLGCNEDIVIPRHRFNKVSVLRARVNPGGHSVCHLKQSNNESDTFGSSSFGEEFTLCTSVYIDITKICSFRN